MFMQSGSLGLQKSHFWFVLLCGSPASAQPARCLSLLKKKKKKNIIQMLFHYRGHFGAWLSPWWAPFQAPSRLWGASPPSHWDPHSLPTPPPSPQPPRGRARSCPRQQLRRRRRLRRDPGWGNTRRVGKAFWGSSLILPSPGCLTSSLQTETCVHQGG